jgi:hypothetical protein
MAKSKDRRQMDLFAEEQAKKPFDTRSREGLTGPDGNPRYTHSLEDAYRLFDSVKHMRGGWLYELALREINGWGSGFYESSSANYEPRDGSKFASKKR